MLEQCCLLNVFTVVNTCGCDATADVLAPMDRDIYKQFMENVFDLLSKRNSFDINRYRRPLRRCLQRRVLDKLQHLQDREDMKTFFSAEWWKCARVQSPLFDDEDLGNKLERWHTNVKKVRLPDIGGGMESTPDPRPRSAPPSLPSKMQKQHPGAGVCSDGMAFLSFLAP